jgi:hypothetical protein
MKHTVTTAIPQDTVAAMQKILGIRQGHWDGAGRDDVIRTFPVRFPDRYEADINNKLSKTKTVIRIGETVKIVNRPLSFDVYSYLRSFHPTAEVWFNGNWRTQAAVQGVL